MQVSLTFGAHFAEDNSYVGEDNVPVGRFQVGIEFKKVGDGNVEVIVGNAWSVQTFSLSSEQLQQLKEWL